MNEIAFRGLVQAMMDAQKLYFKSRKQSDLITAKEMEAQVRKELAAGPDLPPAPSLEETGFEQPSLFTDTESEQ